MSLKTERENFFFLRGTERENLNAKQLVLNETSCEVRR